MSNTDTEETYNQILSNLKSLNENQDLGNTEQYLIDALNSELNACLICIESIGPKEAIWNCDGCFEKFHIFCMQNWIRDGSYQTINSNEEKPKEIPWNCPKCRKEYKQRDSPKTYECFCKKVKNPKFDPWVIPHSCNQRCEKLKPCSHQCLMLCHPGPCPPCPKMIQISCSCKKSTPIPRRCAHQNWSCNKQCNKLMLCKQHLCGKNCHDGSCGICEKTSIQFCQCKKSRKEVSCSETNWSCKQLCNKMYSCGSHKCEQICHTGKCGECPRSLQRSCPCGKSKSQKPCTFEIPPCGDTCDKPLGCGIHRCAQRCHPSDCDTCRQIVTKKCRCGLKEKSLPCYIDFTCETKCSKMRNCGKHKCNKKCCDGIDCAPCEQVCNKQLACKNHKCMSICHSGKCYPCPIFVEVKCPCETTKQKFPCIKSKTDIKVPCKQICQLPTKCHHKEIQKHKCHYNNCPPCNLKCDKKMKCEHICPSKCHSAVLTEVVENKDREGPWEALKVTKKYLNLECPSCLVLMPVKCFGNHEKSNVSCYRAEPYNCGSKCGQLLECTQHRCQFECHVVSKNKNDVSLNCEECESGCELKRPKGCEHECSIGACHPGECPKCLNLTKIKCHCNSNFVYIECNKWNLCKNKDEKDLLKSCKVPCPQTLSCNHSCTKDCHSGPCSSELDCLEKVPIKCACKTLRRCFICKEIRFELVNLIEKTIKGERKLMLKCNEKCELKKNKLNNEGSSEKSIENLDSTKQPNQNFIKYFILAFLVLLIAIFIYYYLILNSS